MADKIRFLTGSLTDLENKSISRGEVYFAIDGDKGKILFDAPINQTTTKRILMGGDSEHADQAEEAKYALYDKGGKDIRTYVASISLDAPGTSLIVKNGKGDTLSTLSPKFLPLTGGKITGELYTDSLTTGDLLVNGSARFVNTILGNIETADKWKTARNFITNLGSTSKAKVDGSQAEYNIGITGILPVANGGTGKNNGTDAANYFLNSLTTGSSNPVDNDYYISQYVNGGTTTTTFHRRPMSALWGYIKTKIKDVLILDETSYNGNAATADKWKNKSNFITNLGSTTKASVDGSQGEYNIGITGTLPIENGGTGATTAAKASENLSTLAALKPSGQSYYVMAAPDGSDNVFIRTTSQGLLPYQSGAAGSGHGNIGTSSWYFKDAYIDNIYGNAASATKLKTARKIITALNSESGGSFDGSADVTIGVSGTLPVSHGGTGVTSVANIQAGKDGDGNTISSTYLKLSGGTMTGNISYKGSKATHSMIRFIDNTTDANGNGISIGGGGSVTIGAGESSQSFTSSGGDETLYLMSDGSIKFYTYCDTIGNKRGVILDTSRNFYPDANNNGSVGTSSNKWASMYASTFYGNLSGTASYATRDSNGQIITDTYLTNVYVSDTTKLYKTVGTSGDSNKNILIGSFTPLDADGLINIKYLPQGALERMHIVANKAARLALTTANVQKGDTVYEDDTGSMYYVYDDTKLNSEDGYRLYSAGTATRVNWSGVQNRPHVVGSSSQTNVISLDAAKTTFTIRVVEKTGTESSYTLTPNFLPLTGGTITGELYVNEGTTLANLLVNGDAKFINTIQGNISGNAGSATKWATEKAFYITDAEAKHTSSPQVNIDGSKSSYTLHLPSTIKATLEGNADTATKLTNLTEADKASSTNTWRRVWFAYDDNVNGRPSYSDTFVYQSSTGTVKATKFQGALAGNATSADKWSTARNFITNLGSESSASVDGSTGPYNLGVTGTLPTNHGGTGNTTFTASRAIYAETATKLSSSGHYMSSSKLAINSTTEPGYQFYVNGSTYLNGKVYINTKTDTAPFYITKDGTETEAVAMSVNDSTYTIAYTNNDTSNQIRIRMINTDTKDGTKDNTTDWSFYFNSSGQFLPTQDNSGSIGTSTQRWANIYASNFRGLADKATSDGSGHNIEDTYLKRSGGTMTGTINSQIVQPKANNTYTLGGSSNRWSTLYSVNIDNSGSWTWYGGQNFILKATANNQEWSFDQCSGSTSYTGTYSHFYSSKNSVSIIRFYTDDNQVQIPSTGFMGIGGAGDASYKLKVTGNTYLTGTLYVGGNSTFNSNLTVNTGGKVKIQNTTDSTYSEDTNAALDIKGGISVDKQMSAKSVRIDNNSKDKGCTLIMNLDLNCLEFVFN